MSPSRTTASLHDMLGYDSIDFDILWRIIRHDLPPLIDALESAIAARGDRGD